jgi:DNA repair exonuclease SbcCD ATPase subunit
MKNMFPLQCVLGIFLCSTWLLVGMDGEQVSPSPRSSALKSKSAQMDDVKLLNVNLITQLTENQTALEGLRKSNTQLSVEKENLVKQIDIYDRKLREREQSEKRLLEEKKLLSLEVASEKKLKETAIEERVDICKRIHEMTDNYTNLLSEKNVQIEDLDRKLKSRQELHQNASQALNNLASKHAQALYYKKIFMRAFITCALALIAHILYMHHESMGISTDLLTSFKEQFSYFSAGTSQSA